MEDTSKSSYKMSNSFVKIVHFTRLVKINNRLREFNFKKNNNAGDYVFDIDTADDRGNRIFFRLIRENDTWRAESKDEVPEWVESHKDQLVSELQEGILEN
ncbi:hypothetical protein [Niabella terrae]